MKLSSNQKKLYDEYIRDLEKEYNFHKGVYESKGTGYLGSMIVYHSKLAQRNALVQMVNILLLEE